MRRRLRIVVLGPNRVGKTAITVRYLTKRFIGEYSSRKDFKYDSETEIDGEMIHLEILDTCRCLEDGMIKKFGHWGEGFLVVFSTADILSFLESIEILKALSSLKPRRPTILVANKTDLAHSRSVSLKCGMETAVSEGCLYLEVSAATETFGSKLAFEAIARLAFTSKNPPWFHFLKTFWSSFEKKRKSKKKFQVKETFIL